MIAPAKCDDASEEREPDLEENRYLFGPDDGCVEHVTRRRARQHGDHEYRHESHDGCLKYPLEPGVGGSSRLERFASRFHRGRLRRRFISGASKPSVCHDGTPATYPRVVRNRLTGQRSPKATLSTCNAASSRANEASGTRSSDSTQSRS